MSDVKKEMFFNVINRYLEQTVFLLRGLGRGELEKKSCTSRQFVCCCLLMQVSFFSNQKYTKILGEDILVIQVVDT